MREATLTTNETTSKGLTSRISWSAILAGTVTAIVIGSMFNLLGIGIGLSSFSFDMQTMGALGIGGIIWLLLSAIVYSLGGGWVSGRFNKTGARAEGMLCGFIAWALSTIFTFYFAGLVISGTSQAVGNSLSAVTQAAASVAPQVMSTSRQGSTGMSLDKITQQANQLFSQAGNNNQQGNQPSARQLVSPQIRGQLQSAISTLASNDSSNAQKNSARQTIANLLVQNANMNQIQAQQTVANIENSIQSAVEATERATAALGRAALITFFALLIGAISAMIGGGIGVRRRNNMTL